MVQPKQIILQQYNNSQNIISNFYKYYNTQRQEKQYMGVTISITTIDQKVHIVRRNDDLTCQDFKQQIYKDLCQQLQPAMMRLERNNLKIDDHQQFVSDFSYEFRKQIVAHHYYGQLQLPILEIVQKKATLEQIKGLKIDLDYQCPVSCEMGASIMDCGHKAGTEFMLGHLKCTVNTGQYEVRCPVKQSGSFCNKVWDLQKCKKVAILTQSEWDNISQGLSNNWIKKNTKKCPKCSHQILKAGFDHNRVKCIKCKSPDFCFFCLLQWKQSGTKKCGNQTCREYQATLANSPLVRKFSLIKNRANNEKIEVETPQHRACPGCQALIQNYKACKHTTCINCKKQFCWVCLSVRQNSNWKCGSYNDYCGAVAPRQKST